MDDTDDDCSCACLAGPIATVGFAANLNDGDSDGEGVGAAAGAGIDNDDDGDEHVAVFRAAAAQTPFELIMAAVFLLVPLPPLPPERCSGFVLLSPTMATSTEEEFFIFVRKDKLCEVIVISYVRE